MFIFYLLIVKFIESRYRGNEDKLYYEFSLILEKKYKVLKWNKWIMRWIILVYCCLEY